VTVSLVLDSGLVTIGTLALDAQGMAVEFGAFKRAWRALLDEEFDHSTWLQDGDPLIDLLRALPEQRIKVLECAPTTEEMSRVFHALAGEVLRGLVESREIPDLDAYIQSVDIQETRVNSASYRPRKEGR